MKHLVDSVFRPVSPGGLVPYYRLVLRGCSQLSFQSNELTGLCFLAAVAVVSPIAGAYFLVAAIMAPGGRMLLSKKGPVIATGLPGLNPCLVALSLPAFFHTGWTDIGMWVVLIVCVAIAVALDRVLVAILPFPIMAFPFVLIFWAIYALSPHLSVLQRTAFHLPLDATFHPATAVLSSLGEAVFSPSVWSGLLFLAGLLLSNWRHAVIAVIGAVIGTAVSYYYRQVDPESVNLGLYGFNGVLTAVAVYVLCGSRLRLAILGALIATIMTSAIAGLGLPAVSAPFVFTTWLVLVLGWVDRKWFAPPECTAIAVRKPTSDIDRHLKGAESMLSPTDSIVFSNLLEQAKTLRAGGEWQDFRPGVTAHWLYREGGDGPSAVLLRYEAGARVTEHEHLGYEHMFVLDGDQFDEHGHYPTGSFVVHLPGTRHSPGSEGGCVALLIYDRAVRFIGGD